MYLFLFLTGCIWLKSYNLFARLMLFLLFLWCSLYGLFMEFGQEIFTNHRTFDWMDALGNTLGAGVGWLAINVLKKWFKA